MSSFAGFFAAVIHPEYSQRVQCSDETRYKQARPSLAALLGLAIQIQRRRQSETSEVRLVSSFKGTIV